MDGSASCGAREEEPEEADGHGHGHGHGHGRTQRSVLECAAMPWCTAILRGTRVLARCDESGALVADGGRVEIRYKPTDGKAYRAALGNLQVDKSAGIHPDEYCGAGAPVEAK